MSQSALGVPSMLHALGELRSQTYHLLLCELHLLSNFSSITKSICVVHKQLISSFPKKNTLIYTFILRI